MQLDGIDVIKECRFCGYLMPVEDIVCNDCNQIPYSIPTEFKDLSFEEIKAKINNAFYRFESFSRGTLKEYTKFDFHGAFSKYFLEAAKPEHYTIENHKLTDLYFELTYQIQYDSDKGEFESETCYNNEAFEEDCNTISEIHFNRAGEFCLVGSNEEKAPKPSITSILNNQTNPIPKSDELDKTRYSLTTLDSGQAQKHNDYRQFKRIIDEEGCFIMTDLDKTVIKFYTPDLAFLLLSKALPAKNLKTKQEITLNGFEDLLPYYIEGYKSGCQFFNTEFAVTRATLYGPQAEEYIADLAYNYFGYARDTTFHKGWDIVKRQYSSTVTAASIKEAGYNAGLVAQVDALQAKYPVAFRFFKRYNPNQETADQHIPSPQLTGLPVFNPRIIEPLLEILKPHFEPKDHPQLDALLLTGKSKSRLHFRANGNKLTDLFKKLYEAHFITACLKEQLEVWIGKHFTYEYRNQIKVFTDDYLEKGISRNTLPCKNPLKGIDKIIK